MQSVHRLNDLTWATKLAVSTAGSFLMSEATNPRFNSFTETPFTLKPTLSPGPASANMQDRLWDAAERERKEVTYLRELRDAFRSTWLQSASSMGRIRRPCWVWGYQFRLDRRVLCRYHRFCRRLAGEDGVACQWVVRVERWHPELRAVSCRWHCLPCVRQTSPCTTASFRWLQPCCHRANPRWERKEHLVRRNQSSWCTCWLRSWFRRNVSRSMVVQLCPSCWRQRSFVWHPRCRPGGRVHGFDRSWRYQLRIHQYLQRRPTRRNQPVEKRKRCDHSYITRGGKNQAYLRCSSDHVLDEITVTWGIDDGDVVSGCFEFPEGNVDGDTTFSFGLEFVENPGVLERTLTHLDEWRRGYRLLLSFERLTNLGSFLLELLDGSFVDTTTFVDEMAGGCRFTGIDVTDDDNVDVKFFFCHFVRLANEVRTEEDGWNLKRKGVMRRSKWASMNIGREGKNDRWLASYKARFVINRLTSSLGYSLARNDRKCTISPTLYRAHLSPDTDSPIEYNVFDDDR